MNGKKTIGMVVVLAVLAGVAILQKKRGGQSRPNPPDKILLEGIDLNAVTGMDVEMGSNSVSLAKADGLWRVESLHGYPADFKKMAKAIRAMAEVKLGNAVRAGNVGESEFGFGKGSRRIVLKAGDGIVAQIEVGARREASDTAGWANQFFMRQAGDESIYLVDYAFRPFSEKPEDWIVRRLLNVRSSDIVSVEAGDVELKLDGAAWTLADLDAEKEVLQSSEANQLRSALQYLDCESIVGKAGSDAGPANAVEYIARDKNGLVYTVTLGGENGRHARFNVAFNKPAAPTAPAEDAEQEEKDAYQKELEAFNKTAATQEKKAAELNAKLQGWIYLLSESEAADFAISRASLVKPKETKETEGDVE